MVGVMYVKRMGGDFFIIFSEQFDRKKRLIYFPKPCGLLETDEVAPPG